MNISKEVNELKNYLIQTRRYLHQNPESSLKEYDTSAFIQQELDKADIAYQKIGQTGTLAEINGAHPGKTIFLRAAWNYPTKRPVPTPQKEKAWHMPQLCSVPQKF